MPAALIVYSHLKFYLYAIHAFNLVIGALGLLFGLMPNKKGLLERLVLLQGTPTQLMVIIICSALCVISIIGVLATLSKKRFLLNLLITLLWTIAVIEIILAILIVVQLMKYRNGRFSYVENVFSEFETGYDEERVEKMQIKYKCCGVYGIDYWKGNIPASCCKTGATEDATTCQKWEEGCAYKLAGPMIKYSWRLFVAIFAVAWVQCFGAVCTARYKKGERRTENIDPKEAGEVLLTRVNR